MNNDNLIALGIDQKWLQPLLDTFIKYNISTTQRQACFIGQCAHESGNFRILAVSYTHLTLPTILRV